MRPSGWMEDGFALQLLRLPAESHRGHYEVICNEYLIPLFHHLFHLPSSPVFDARFWQSWRDYLEVNARYARAALAAPEPGPVFVHDFHLLAVAQSIRRASPSLDRPLLYFHHVPWCDAEYFSLLPRRVVDEIVASVTGYDVIAFNAARWRRNFLACCHAIGLPVTQEGGVLSADGRHVEVMVAPAPIDVAAVRSEAQQPATRRHFARLEHERAGRWALLRVDRVDPWKNVLNGFLAFESLMARRPELAGKLWFLAVLTPARTWSAEYRRYLRDSLVAARRINERFGGAGPEARNPVTVSLARGGGTDHARAFAGMQIADAVLITSFFDGLNIVAKESAVTSTRHSVLILSQNAGVFEQVGDAALPIDPCDPVGIGQAIERAYRMRQKERTARNQQVRRVVEAETPQDWVLAQLKAANLSRRQVAR